MDDTYFPTDEELNAGVAKLINYNAMLALINECLAVLVELVRLHEESPYPVITTEIRDNIEHNLLPQIQRIFDMEDDLEDEIGKLRMLGNFGQDSIH